MNHAQQSTIFLVIFTIWIATLILRVFDKTLKKYTLSIGICLIFWMIIKVFKHYTTGSINHYMWYLYYLPLIFIPTFYYNCSEYLLIKDNNKKRIIAIGISIILFLLVITNDSHQLIFKILNENNDYIHKWGYYLVCIWIFLLLIMAVKNLVKVSMAEKDKKKTIIPFIPIILGLIYTVIYVLDIGFIEKTNMAIVIGTLFCIGLEVLFRLGLIPNNFRYRKIFLNSNLPIEIISKDGTKKINTNHYIEVEENIIKDIKNNELKKQYKAENKIQNVKSIQGGYAVEEKDISKINDLKKKLENTNQELLKQEELLKNQKKIKEKIFEVKIKNEIIELLDEKIDEKREHINKMLDEMTEVDVEKMYMIKLLINYCKRMSSLVISSYNKEKYNNKRIETIINELLSEAKELNTNGVLQTNNFEINSSETTTIYEIVFEIIYRLKDVNFILNIEVNNTYIKLKYLFDKNIKVLKQKLEELKLERITGIDEKNNEDETRLEIEILRGES